MKTKILLLEDDFHLGETIQDILIEHNYIVDYVRTGNDAIDFTYDNKYDLYIFDINVPDIDGLDILKSLRYASDFTPTIFISAMTDLKTILKGFEVGACDFIKKPFYLEELITKVNLKFINNDGKIIYNDLEYLPKNKQIIKNNKSISLGDVAILIFEIFINNINKIILKEELYDCMDNSTPNALRVHISNISRITGIKIKNIRGIGYIVENSK